MKQGRVKVTIKCRKCGERFTLRGRRSNNEIHTGFLRCICDNDTDLEWITEDL